MKYLICILALVAVAVCAAPIPTVSSHATPALVDEINTTIADIQTKVGTNGISAASFATNAVLTLQRVTLAGTNGVTASVVTNVTITIQAIPIR